MKYTAKTKIGKIKYDLKRRFEKGERLSIEQALELYFQPKSAYTYLTTKKLMASLIRTIRWMFGQEGISFGSINKQNQYGIPQTEEEFTYFINLTYKQVKGTVRNVSYFVADAKTKGLLPNMKSEKMLISHMNGEDKNVSTTK